MNRLFLAWLCIATLSAKDVAEVCGTFANRAQQELFLHRRSLLARARNGFAPREAVAPLRQDIGDVAIIDDSNGVIERRNAFDLDRRTVTFLPAGATYVVQAGNDTFDPALGQSGSRIDNFTDDDTRRFALPFPFTFYGRTYREIWVNSNGTLSFEKGDTDYSGSYGHFASAPPTIAGLFADLNPPGSTSGVRVLSDASRFVVTWSEVPLADSAAFGRAQIQTFQIRLDPSGRIEFAYRSSNPPDALVGITPGNLSQIDLATFSTPPPTAFSNGIADVFSSADAVDAIAASQSFYATHEDAYDYLVFYNADSVRASAGAVAYEITARSSVQGIGDVAIEDGAQYGSAKRLKAVLNMGPLSQYPMNPNGVVAARAPIGDTPVTLLAHEAGHLFLALASVADPAVPNSTPMLTADQAHWAFPFQSEASVMGGERIRDNGALFFPRYTTIATVEGYGPIDQYLMGLRSPDEVPPTFVVLNSGNASRTSQAGINFDGTPLTVTAQDIAARYGRRTPDSTLSQKRFRFGFVLIVPTGAYGATIASGAAQIEEYRREFEGFYARATSNRATAESTFRKGVDVSVAPAAGLLEGAEASVKLSLSAPVTEALTFTLRRPNSVLAASNTVTLLPGASSLNFSVFGIRSGIEELALEPSNPLYETVTARIQVNSPSALRVAVNGTAFRVEDINRLPYSGVSTNVGTSGTNGTLVFDPPASNASIYVTGAVAPPTIDAGGVVDAATYIPRLVPGGYVSVFGHGLQDAQVRINGTLQETMYTSDRQVNFRAPATILPGRLTIETSQGVALAPLPQ